MTRLLAVVVAIVLFCAFPGGRVGAAPVYWVPDADGNWRDSTNWSSHPNLPQPSDDVTIDVGGPTLRTVTVESTQVSIHTLQCQESLTFIPRGGGDDKFTVGAGGGYVSGDFTIGGYSFTVQDGGAFTANGATTMEDGDLRACGGSSLSLPSLSTWAISYGGRGTVLAEGKDASGTGALVQLAVVSSVTGRGPLRVDARDGGRVDLSALATVGSTSIAGSALEVYAEGHDSLVDLSQLDGLPSRTTVRATNGGIVDLGALTSHNGYSMSVKADGTGSVVDLSSLAHFTCAKPDPSCDECGLEVRNGGQIILPSTLTALDNACLTIGMGNIPTTHIERITNGTITIDQGVSVSFDALSTMDNCEIYVKAGSSLSMPSLRALTNGTGTYGLNAWGTDAMGKGSLLDLSSVTSAEGYLNVEALNGAKVDLSNLQTYLGGKAWFEANGAGSVLDLSGLTRFNGWTNPAGHFEISTFRVLNGGEIILPVGEHVLDGVQFMVSAGGMSTGQFTHVLNGSIAVGGSVSFDNVRYVYNTDLSAGPGGTLSLSGLTRLNMAAGGENELQAVGAEAVLDLSSVTQIAGQGWQLSVWAGDGGIVDLSGLRSSNDGTMQVLTRGSESVVDLSGLSSLSGAAALQRAGLRAEESGKIYLPETLQTLEGVNLWFQSGGTITTHQLTDLIDGSISVWEGATPSFGSLTRLHNASVEANYATLALPSLTTASMASDAEKGHEWRAHWYGRLDLSSLTTIAGDDWKLTVEAFLGGTVDLSALTTINGSGWILRVITSRHDETVDLSSLLSIHGGTMNVTADGENTVVDLSGLTEFICGHPDPSRGDCGLEVRDGGRIILPDAPIELDKADLTIGSGTINTEQITRFGNATLTVTRGAAPPFGALTTMHNS